MIMRHKVQMIKVQVIIVANTEIMTAKTIMTYVQYYKLSQLWGKIMT